MSAAKGYCDDLTEGKYSLPILHALHHPFTAENSELENVLRSRTQDNNVKAYITRYLETKTGSFEYTRMVLRKLDRRARECLAAVEGPVNGKMKGVIDGMMRVVEGVVFREGDDGGVSNALRI